MRNSKTSLGIPIRSTLGMGEGRQNVNWVLVADRHRLCLYEKVEDETGSHLSLRQEFGNPEGRLKEHEMVSDRAGRTFDSHDSSHHGQSGGARHAYGGASDAVDHVVKNLISEAVRLVEASKILTKAATLMVVAEPKLMGLLRPALEKAASQVAMTFEEKDYAWLSESELPERLKSLCA